MFCSPESATHTNTTFRNRDDGTTNAQILESGFCNSCKTFSALVILSVLFFSGFTAKAANDLYWDTNGTTAGSGAATGTWGTSNFFNSDPAGVANTFTAVTGSANDIHFSAGANGTVGTVTINGSQSANSISLEQPGAVTFSGGTSLNLGSGGIKTIAGSGASAVGTAIVFTSPTSTITSGSTTALSVSGGISGTSNLTFQANSGIANTNSILVTGTINNIGTITNSGAGVGRVRLDSIGSNVSEVIQNSATSLLDFRGSNSFGKLTILQGTVNLQSAGASISDSAEVAISSGAVLTVSSASGEAIGALSGAGTVQLGSAAKTFTVNSDGSSSTFSGVINGNGGSVTKAGAGTLVLSGANIYSGATTISAGTLLVDGTHTASLTTGAYLVSTGGTLGGGGTITLSNASVTVSSGGKLSAGDSVSPGTLTMNLGTGSLDISGAVGSVSSGSMIFDLVSPFASDKVLLTNAASSLSIGTGVLEFDDFVFSALPGFSPGVYTLFSSNSAIVGTLGANLSGLVGGYGATLSFGTLNQDILLTVAVPEPGTGSLLLMAAGGAIVLRRIRRSSRLA